MNRIGREAGDHLGLVGLVAAIEIGPDQSLDPCATRRQFRIVTGHCWLLLVLGAVLKLRGA